MSKMRCVKITRPAPVVEQGPQKVREGYTINGNQRGLFTGMYLVIHLREGEDAEAVAKRHGFEFVS
jgi:hypothetical protein